MEQKDYAIAGITILLLISLGINVMPTDTHYCQNLELSMKCARLSSTEKTCYPSLDTNKGSKYCSTKWQNIIFNQEPKEELSFDNSDREQYVCSVNECELKENGN